MKKKLIVLASSWFTVEHFFRQQIIELGKVYDVFVVFDHDDPSYDGCISAYTQTIDIKIPRNISIVNDASAFFQLFRLLKKNRYSCVISLAPKAGLLGMLVGYLLGVKVRIHIFQGEVWSTKSLIWKLILKLSDKFIMKASSDFLFVSKALRSFFAESNLSIAAHGQVIGPGTICGIDTKRFNPGKFNKKELRNYLGLSEGSFICLYVGRLSVDKGIELFIEAGKSLLSSDVNVQFVIVGPEEDFDIKAYTDNLEEKVRKNILYVGYSKEVEVFYAAADAFIFPSRREGFGMAVLEASAMELPVVLSQAPGLADAFMDGITGFACEAHFQAYANKIQLLLQNENLVKEMGRHGRKFVMENFESNAICSAYVKHIVDKVG